MTKKIYNVGFVSLGCAKNLVDTENMIGILGKEYQIINEPENADVLVVNTCGFITSAKEESIQTILEMAEYKNGRCRALIVTGCLAERYNEELLAEMPEVDAILGTGDYHRIAEAIKSVLGGKKFSLYGHFNEDIAEGERKISTPSHVAYIKIADGCDNRCTYCIIPYLRGKYRSRPAESILKEAQGLADNGVKELIVIAQDTTRYQDGDTNLAKLLKKLCEIDGIKWIRVHYLYPEAITEELIEVFRFEPKILKYMDVPIQHANDRILKRMGRRTNKAQLTALFKELREKIEGIVIRSTVITGFPGETQEEFNELLAFLKAVRFDRLGAFAYSPEEGTPAALFEDQIDEKTKEARQREVHQLQEEISLELQNKKIGQRFLAVAEGYEEESFMYYGRTYAHSLDDIDGRIYFAADREINIGEFVEVEILNADQYDLIGIKL